MKLHDRLPRTAFPTLCLLGGAVIALVVACGGGNAEETGSACSAANQCFSKVEEPLRGGEAMCLDRVPGGYCTHECTSDADCCAVKDECRTGLPQVCSPYESSGKMYCFLSCEGAVVSPSGLEEGAFCEKNAGDAFSCRSSGGGSANRKVCVPNG